MWPVDVALLAWDTRPSRDTHVRIRMSRDGPQIQIPQMRPAYTPVHTHTGTEGLREETDPRVREDPSIECVVQIGEEAVHVRRTEPHAKKQMDECEAAHVAPMQNEFVQHGGGIESRTRFPGDNKKNNSYCPAGNIRCTPRSVPVHRRSPQVSYKQTLGW